jgi:hypothetical protein
MRAIAPFLLTDHPMTRDDTAWRKFSGKISEIVFLNELLKRVN